MYITVGRNPKSNIVITGYDVVSFDHATIEYNNGQFLFIDDSSNGTLVNGRLIHHSSCPVSQTDVIMLAGVCPLKWEQIMAQVPAQNTPPQMAGRPTQLYGGASQNQQPYGSQQQYGGQQQYSQPQYAQAQYNGQQNYGNASAPSQQQSKFDDRDLDRWHWGAFFLGWIWGVFNHVYWTLVALIPIPLLGLVINIIAAIKGRRQSWENGRWRPEDYERFEKNQKGWSIAGIVVFGVCVLLSIISWSILASTLSIISNWF